MTWVAIAKQWRRLVEYLKSKLGDDPDDKPGGRGIRLPRHGGFRSGLRVLAPAYARAPRR